MADDAKRNALLTGCLFLCTAVGCLVVGGCVVRIVMGGMWNALR